MEPRPSPLVLGYPEAGTSSDTLLPSPGTPAQETPAPMLEGCTPWPEEFARRYRAAGYWMDITLGELLARSARERAAQTAMIQGDRSLTYAELLDRADRLAVAFSRLGIASRERVIFQLGNSLEFLVAFLALLRVGAIPVMTLPAHRQEEVGHFARHARASAYLIPADTASQDYRALAERVRAVQLTMRTVITAGPPGPGQTGLQSLLDQAVGDDELAAMRAQGYADAGDVALMVLSGGTTARPKMIPRTHNDYVYNCLQSGRVAGFGPDTVYLASLPMAHGYTLSSPGVLATLAHGGTVVLASDTRAETVFPLIERHRVTVVAGGTPLAVNWLNSSAPDRHDLSSWKVYMNGGSRLPPALRERIEQRFGVRYMESYGTGEGLLNQTRLDDPAPIRFNSSGRPISEADEIRVIDDQGAEVPDGTPGELCVRGPYTVRGYYLEPELTAQAYTADGYYRMGDRVRRVDGTLYLEGRIKDLINRGGEKISTEEVENHLVAHPAVANACVVAMPDPVHGEKACAFVVLKPGQAIDFESMKSHLIDRGIAKFKLPERLEIVDAFPLSPAGKVLRRELRATIGRLLEDNPPSVPPSSVEGDGR